MSGSADHLNKDAGLCGIAGNYRLLSKHFEVGERIGQRVRRYAFGSELDELPSIQHGLNN